MFQLLEHTADMGIEARAESREKVLLEMARGLAGLMFGDGRSGAESVVEVAVQAEDSVELLVAWLNEIVYWSDSGNFVPVAFRIVQLTDTTLQAVINGELFSPECHSLERQVKSVTYHQACLEENPEGWYARVYVDL